MTRAGLPTPPELTFEPLGAEHMVLLHRWLNEGPVLEWYARRPQSLIQVEEHYGKLLDGSAPTRGYVLLADGAPAGFWQTYLIADHPRYARSIAAEAGWAGMDFFLGATEWRGRGLSSLAHELFVETHVFAAAEVTACVAGPNPANSASIRSLERARFRRLRTVEVEPGSYELLLLRASPAPSMSA